MTASAPDRWPQATDPLPDPPRLLDIGKASLFLDFDGTLVELARSPDAIEVAAMLPALLMGLDTVLSGRLAIVSGRAIADIDGHLGPIGVAIAGSHGGELRPGGARITQPLADPLPEQIQADLHALARKLGGLLVENKPFGAAIHYRTRPEAGPEVLDAVAALAQDAGITLKRGKMVAELVMPGADKGSAVNRFMQMPGFAGSRPIFVGDDITDEDAFRSVRDHGGSGILVGPQRETAAIWRLDAVPDVHAWLRAALA